jgi:dTDP-4-dehydrorhamnose 3,5-epimerase-like enzyme
LCIALQPLDTISHVPHLRPIHKIQEMPFSPYFKQTIIIDTLSRTHKNTMLYIQGNILHNLENNRKESLVIVYGNGNTHYNLENSRKKRIVIILGNGTIMV